MLRSTPLRFIRPHAFIIRLAILSSLAAFTTVGGCASSITVDDPIAELSSTTAFPSRQIAAMNMLDEQPSEEYLTQLHRIIWVPGYTQPIREEALVRLERHDFDGLQRTIRQHLPRMTMWGWLTRLSEIIAERGWEHQTPALVSSWARPAPLVREETDRPEYQALVKLHGKDNLPDVVFNMFVEASSVAEQGLRTRCWQLLHRLGYRDRLVDLVANTDPPEDDAMLRDLHAGARDLGIVPHNREEILWLRELRKPERAEFWSQAKVAVQSMSKQRLAELELRDVPIAVAAYLHEPELLEWSNAQLYDQLAAKLRGQRHHGATSDRMGMPSGRSERLQAHRHDLTWGDLAAMLLAVRAFQVPAVVDHLFDYAERDMRDESTEYGGIVNLDEQGRFELLEFPPRIRQHANKFNAPQEMFDAGYTGLFHFHNHAQRYRNSQYASPGFGDLQYADNTRANCLVFTFINENTLNVDFYRHGGVVVDLGEIQRR
jgi:hypothetical protein